MARSMRPTYSLMTGFIGTAWISKALSENGHSELAYRLLHNNQYPSWLYAIDQGATSIWERLNGYTVENGFGGNNSMNSFNHYSFGAVGQWMMSHSLGIERDEPGFQRFILQPEPDPTGVMTWAEGYYDSMYGRISSAWKVDGDDARPTGPPCPRTPRRRSTCRPRRPTRSRRAGRMRAARAASSSSGTRTARRSTR